MKTCIATGTLLAFFLTVIICPAQNLVPNCDFDLFTSCPNDHGLFDLAASWFTPGEGTTDFCHECSGNRVTIPMNTWGEQMPFSGGGYGHIISYYPFQGNDYREYMEVELACPLVAGEEYDVSFYVSCSDRSRYAIDGMGLHFSSDPWVQNLNGVILIGGPAHVTNTPGMVIMNQTGWSKVSGKYVASGGERFITIGNFVRDNDLTIHNFSGQTTRYCSYYVDLVSVVPVTEWLELGNDTTVCPLDTFLVDASLPCDGDYLWSNGSTEPFIEITQPGYYSVTLNLGCGSITKGITVNHFPHPVFRLPEDTIVCENSYTVLDAGEFISYSWNTGHTGRYLEIQEDGEYRVELLDASGCSYSDTCQVSILSSPVSLLPPDTVICLDDSLFVEAGPADKYHQYTWYDLATESYRTFNDPGLYWVEITNPCGAVNDSLDLEKVNCETAIWIPNAFTPDNDGRNDNFRARGQNITDFVMIIFNRWGEKIYETEDMDKGWDGRTGGEYCPGGAYVYLISFRPSAVENAAMEARKGTFMLIR